MPVINNGSEYDRTMRLQKRIIYAAFLVEKQAVEDKKLVRTSLSGVDYSTYTPLQEAPLLFTPDELNAVVANNRTLDSNNVIVYGMIVSSFAGSGIAGFSDGPIATASFYAPQGAVFDASGSMYIADTENNRIRKISSNGTDTIVETYAGTGIAGFTNGAASSATFNYPVGIAIDASGNIYVADTGNNAIRMISATSPLTVSTVAGTGSSGFSNTPPYAFNNPTGIVVDSSGNIYVSDSGNNVIRKITQSSPGVASSVSTLTTGGVTTVPPSDSYPLNNPQGLALDSTGNLYIADKGNNTIRKIDLDVLPLVIKTLAGSPPPTPPGSEDGNGGEARFDGPTGVVVDSQGNVFVTDTGNHTIRKITNTGETTTFAGSDENSTPSDGSSETAGFSSPGGITIDPSGNLYVLDLANSSISRLTLYDISLPPPVNLPGAVSDLQAYPGNAFVNLIWTAPESEDLAITGYSITITPPRQLLEEPIIVRDTFSNITGLLNSTLYTFTISAITSLGLSPSASIPSTPLESITPSASSAPVAPTITSSEAGNNSIFINWTHPTPSSLRGYKITVSTTGSSPIVVFTKNISDTSERECIINALMNNVSYNVSVYAINNFGISPAATVNVTPEPVTDPPVFTSSSSAHESVTLNWLPNVAYDVSSPTSFNIYYYIGSGSEEVIRLIPSSSRTITINPLLNGNEYTFRMTSTNNDGESPRSIPVKLTPNPLPPSPITLGQLIAKDQSAIVPWTVPYNGGSPITSYTIKAIPSVGSSIVEFNNITDPALLSKPLNGPATFKANGLTNGTTYTFIVTANNGYISTANRDSSGGGNVTPIGQLPDQPTFLTAVRGNESVRLGWTVPDVNSWSIPGVNGQAIESYRITICDSNGVELGPLIQQITVNASSLTVSSNNRVSYNVTGLTNILYKFKIASYNGQRGGFSSDVLTEFAVRPNIPTAAPTQLAVISKYQSAFVSWTPPTTNPSLGIPNISSYTVKVYDSNGNNFTPPISHNVTAPASSFTVPSLTNDIEYKISIIANNSAGASPETSKLSVIPAIQIPDTITNVSLAPIYSDSPPKLRVNWTAPVYSGGPSIISYTIRYYDTYGVLKGTIVVPTTSLGPPPHFTYIISGPPLENNTEYTATVTANNGVYNSPGQSIDEQISTNTVNDSLIAAQAIYDAALLSLNQARTSGNTAAEAAATTALNNAATSLASASSIARTIISVLPSADTALSSAITELTTAQTAYDSAFSAASQNTADQAVINAKAVLSAAQDKMDNMEHVQTMAAEVQLNIVIAAESLYKKADAEFAAANAAIPQDQNAINVATNARSTASTNLDNSQTYLTTLLAKLKTAYETPGANAAYVVNFITHIQATISSFTTAQDNPSNTIADRAKLASLQTNSKMLLNILSSLIDAENTYEKSVLVAQAAVAMNPQSASVIASTGQASIAALNTLNRVKALVDSILAAQATYTAALSAAGGNTQDPAVQAAAAALNTVYSGISVDYLLIIANNYISIAQSSSVSYVNENIALINTKAAYDTAVSNYNNSPSVANTAALKRAYDTLLMAQTNVVESSIENLNSAQDAVEASAAALSAAISSGNQTAINSANTAVTTAATLLANAQAAATSTANTYVANMQSIYDAAVIALAAAVASGNAAAIAAATANRDVTATNLTTAQTNNTNVIALIGAENTYNTAVSSLRTAQATASAAQTAYNTAVTNAGGITTGQAVIDAAAALTSANAAVVTAEETVNNTKITLTIRENMALSISSANADLSYAQSMYNDAVNSSDSVNADPNSTDAEREAARAAASSAGSLLESAENQLSDLTSSGSILLGGPQPSSPPATISRFTVSLDSSFYSYPIIRWNVPYDRNNPITKYTIQIGNSQGDPLVAPFPPGLTGNTIDITATQPIPGFISNISTLITRTQKTYQIPSIFPEASSYTFKMKSTNSSDQTSEFSDIRTLVTRPTRISAAPTVSQVGQTGSVRVTWTASQTVAGGTIAKYTIVLYNSSFILLDSIDVSGTLLEKTISSIPFGITFTSKVYATDENGTPSEESPTSPPFTLSIRPTQIRPSAVDTNNGAIITWEVPNNQGSTIGSYIMYAYVSSGNRDGPYNTAALTQIVNAATGYASIFTALQGQTVYAMFTGLTNLKHYKFKITAGKADNSGYYAENEITDFSNVVTLDIKSSITTIYNRTQSGTTEKDYYCALDPTGNYMYQYSNVINRLLKIDTTKTYNTSGTNAHIIQYIVYTNSTGSVPYPFRSVLGMCMDSTGAIFVVDGNTIVKIMYNTTNNRYVGTIVAGSNEPSALLSNTVELTRGLGTENIPAARFNNIRAIACDKSDNLYVTDNGNFCIRKLTKYILRENDPYEVTRVFVNGALYTTNVLYGIVVDSNFNLYIAENNRIHKLRPNAAKTTFVGVDIIAGPTAAGSTATGDTDGISSAASFGGLRGITVDFFGNLYVTDNPNNRICIVTPNSTGTIYTTSTIFRGITSATPIADTVPTIDSDLANNVKGNIRNIEGISIDPENNIYVVSTGYVTIRKIQMLTGLGVLLQGNKYVNGSGTWIDQTGKENNASLIRSPEIIQLTSGLGSLSRNSTNNGIVLDGKSAWNLKPPTMRSNWTASVWFKHTALTEGETAMIFSSQVENGRIYFYIGNLRPSSRAAGSYQVGFYDSQTIYSSTDFTPGNEWVNIVGVYDAENSTLTTYINGSVYHILNITTVSPTYISNAGPSDASGYIIGGYLEGENKFVVGEIGEVRLYNYPRSQGEVTADYNESAPTFSVLKQPANIVYTNISKTSITLRWSGEDTGTPYSATSYLYSINGITSGMMLATGEGNGSMKYSIDGLVWNNTVGGFSTLANGSAWCKYFWTLVAVGEGDSSIKYSFNGINWYNATGGFSISGKGIAWNNAMPTPPSPPAVSTASRMVAVGTDAIANRTIKYSTDGGKDWINAAGGFNLSGNGVAFGVNLFVAVGSDSGGNTIKYSNDGGNNWITSSKINNSTLFTTSGNGVAASSTRFVAVGSDSGGNTIKYSNDGNNWINATSGLFASSGNGVAFNGLTGSEARWVAVGSDTGGNTIKYSSDGNSWTDAQGGFANEATGVTWNSVLGKWFATGIDSTNAGNTVKTSIDGITWTNINGLFNTKATSVSSVAQFITSDNGLSSKSAVVSISPAVPSYTGMVSAIRGSVKRVSAPFDLVLVAPTTPILMPPSDITANSITLNWTGGDGATSYSYAAIDTSLIQFVNSIYQTRTIRDTIIPSADNSLTYKQATFTRLKPNVTYKFQITATNSIGSTNSDANNTISFITTLNIPPPRPPPFTDNIVVPAFRDISIAPTPTGFLIKWNSTSNIINSYEYYLSTVNDDATILATAPVTPIAHDIAKGFNWIGAFAYIGNLLPETIYFLIAKATNALGFVYSNKIKIETTKKEKVLSLKASTYSGTGTWNDDSGKNNHANPYETGTRYRKNAAGNGIVINLDIPNSFNNTNIISRDGLSWTIPNPKLNNTWTMNIWYKSTGFDNVWGNQIESLHKIVFAQLGVDGTNSYPLSTNASIKDPFSFGNSKNFSMNIESIASFKNPTIGSGNILSSSIGPIGYRYIYNLNYLRRLGGENTWYNFQYTWDGQYLSTYINGVLIHTYRNKVNNQTENRLENNLVLVPRNKVEGKPASTTLFNNRYNDTSGQSFEMPTHIFSSGTYNGFCISEDNGEEYAIGRFYGEIGEISAYSYARTPVEITTDYLASVRTYKEANVYVVEYNTDGSVKWTRIIRGFTNDFPIKKLVDGSGNVYVSGSYNSPTGSNEYKLDIYNSTGTPSFSLTNPGIESTYLVKYDMNGTPQWARNIGGPTGSARVVDMKFDTVGSNIYICGYFSCPTLNIYNSSETTPSFSLTNPIADQTYISKHTFIVKYAMNDGTPIFARKVGGNNFFVYPTNIDIDSTGNVYTCVESRCNIMDIYNEGNTITFTDTNSYLGRIGTYIIKYSASGTPLLYRMIGNGGDNISNNNNKTDSNGNTYLTLEINLFPTGDWLFHKTNSSALVRIDSKLDLDGLVSRYPNSSAVYKNTQSSVIVKYDTNGAIMWLRNIVSGQQAQHIRPMNTIIDTSGNLYVSFTDSANAPIVVYETEITPKYSFPQQRNTACFVKYDLNGQVLWANIIRNVISYSSFKNTLVNAHDSNGNMYVSGNFTTGFLNIYNGADVAKPYMILRNNTATSSDIFVIKYGTNGTPIWARKIGGTSEDMVVSIVADSTNNCLYVSGNFTSPTLNMYDDIDRVISGFSLSNSTPVVNEGFIITYDMNGNVIASRKIVNSIGSGNNTLVTTMMDSSGNLHLSGYSNSADSEGNPIILTSSGAPSITSVEADQYTDTSIKLSLTAPLSGTATIPLIQNYRIKIYNASDTNTIVSTYEPSPPITGSSCIVPGLTTGTSYKFSISARNSIGYSPDSDFSAAVAPISNPPGAPTNFTATLSGDQATSVVLSWRAPVFGNRPITGYTIRQSIDGSETELPGTNFVSPHTINNLTPNSRYTYTIKAINDLSVSSTNSANSNEVTAGTTVKASITSIVPSATDTTIDFSVAYGARVSNIEYRLYNGTTLIATLTQSDITTQNNLLKFTGVAMLADTQYNYYIKTFNGSIELYQSDTVQSTRFTVKASTMAAPTATANSGFARVTWTAPTLPTSATTILYYIVSAYTFNPNDLSTSQQPVSTENTWSISTSFDYPNLTNGISYKFTVKAVNRAGENIESALSAVEVKPLYPVNVARFTHIVVPNIQFFQGFAAFDSTQQNIYISDIDGKAPVKAVLNRGPSQNGTQITVTNSMTGVGKTYGIVLDSAENIYLSSIDTSTITKLTKQSNGTYIKSTIFTEVNNSQIIGLAIDNNHIYASASYDSTPVDSTSATYTVNIYKISINDPSNHTVIATYTSTVPTRVPTATVPPQPAEPTTNLGPARGIALDSTGNVYITDANHTIRKLTKNMDETYTISTYVGIDGSPGKTDGPIGQARVTSPFAITVDSAGNIYFVDYDGTAGNSKKTIRMIYNKNGEQYVTTLRTLEDSSRSNHIWGLIVDSSNNLFACYKEDNHIWKIFIDDVTIPSPVIENTIVGYPGVSSVTLYWSPPSYNGTSLLTPTDYAGFSPITSYTIIYYAGPSYDIPTVAVTLSQTEANSALLASITPYYTVTGLQNGTSYKFAVISRNYLGTSEISPLSAAYTPINATTPSFPRIISATAGPGQSTVTWDPPTSNGGATITSYTVTSYPGGITATSSTTSATVTGLRGGTSYRFTVVATNFAGNSSPSLLYPSLLLPSVTPTIGPPSTPQTLTATLSGDLATEAILSWSPSTGSNGNPVTGYTITAINTTNSTQVEYSNISSSPPYTTTISGLTPGKSYRFTIKSENGASSLPSAQTSSIITGTVAQPVITSVTQSASGNRVNFSVAYGKGISNITYKLYKGIVTGGTVASYSFHTIISPSSLQFTNVASFLTLDAGTTYRFYMTSILSGSESSPSNNVDIIGESAPTAPSISNVNVRNGFATITWTAPSNNGNSTILYYKINAYATAIHATNVVASRNTFDNSTLTFDFPLLNGVSYTFKVQAVNTYGEGTLSSESSLVKPAYTVTAERFASIDPTLCSQGFAAFDSTQENLYITHTGNNRLPVRLNMLTKQVQAIVCSNFTTTLPNTGAYGIGLDLAGNIYIATLNGKNVQKLINNNNGTYTKDSTPVYTAASSTGLFGLTMDLANGYIYVTEDTIVHRININDNSETPVFTNGGSGFRGIALDSVGNIYIADRNRCCIRRLESGTYAASMYVGSNGNCGNIDGPALTARIHAPYGITVDSADNVYFVQDYNTDNIATGGRNICMIYNKNGSAYVTTLYTFPPDDVTPPQFLYGLTIDSSNNLYACYKSDNHLWKVFIQHLSIPSPVQSISGTAGANSVALSWAQPQYNGNSNSPITSYKIIYYTSPNYDIPTVVIPSISNLSNPSYTVTGLQNGTPYKFKIVSINAQGTSDASALSAEYTPLIITTPSSPTGVSAVAGNAQAVVSWALPTSNGGAAITSYRVTSSPSGFTATVLGATTATATVTGLTNGTSYTFTVVAINSVGDSSASLASTAVTPRTTPSSPTSISAVPGDREASVSWTLPTSNGGAAIISYRVTSSPGGLTATVSGATTATATVTGLTNGTSYTFTVVATNSAGNSSASLASTAVTLINLTVPSEPTGVTAVRNPPNSHQASVSWTAPVSDGGSPITSYSVNGRPVESSNPIFQVSTTVSAGTTTTTLTGMHTGFTYGFTVEAINSVGSSSAALATNLTVPSSPTGVSAVAGNAQAVVSWTLPTSNGGAAITSYRVTSSPSGFTATVLGATTATATVTGLTNGTSYTFTVVAINSVGDSSASLASTDVTPTEPSNIVTTFAGGPGGYQNGTGTNATFSLIFDLAIDANGNIYVADAGFHNIRKVTPLAVVSIFAGSESGSFTFYGPNPDGTGTNASFYFPMSVAVSTDGYIYVADANNNRIRRVNSQGVVTTIAGSGMTTQLGQNPDGYSTSASFNSPRGIAIGPDGNIYVADAQNNRIRKIDLYSGEVTTIAGSQASGSTDGTGTDALFDRPSSLVVDPNGNIYVADSNNHRIRKITPAGVVSTLAGGPSGYNDGNGTNAEFSLPSGIAIAPGGDIYVADTNNHRIRKVTTTGVVTTVAGNGTGAFADGTLATASFNEPYGLIVAPNGTIYVADKGNSRIRKIFL